MYMNYESLFDKDLLPSGTNSFNLPNAKLCYFDIITSKRGIRVNSFIEDVKTSYAR